MTNTSSASTCTLFYDALLQPYWSAIVTTFCMFFFSLMCSVIQQICCKKKKDMFTVLLAFSTVHPFVAVVQTIFLLFYFGYIIHFVRTNGEPQSGWEKYTQIYVHFINSGATSVFASLLFHWISFLIAIMFDDSNDNEEEANAHQKLLEENINELMIPCVCFYIVGAVLFPIIMTHWIPISCAYVWLLCIYGIALRVWSFFVNLEKYPYVNAILLRVLVLSFAIIFQSLFNYAVLLYDGENYIALIGKEFNMRKSKCYIDSINQSWQQSLSFVSIF